MATKEQWIELVNLKLSGGDAPAQIQGRYSPQEIELYLTMAFNDILSKAWVEYPDLLSDYYRTVVKSIEKDTTRDERYVEIEGGILPLPKDSGLIQVRSKRNPYMQFIIQSGSSMAVFEELEVSYVNGRVGCYVEGSRIYFDYNLPKEVEDCIIKYITPFEGLSDTDEVSVPFGGNQAVFDSVYRLMLKELPNVNQDNMVTKQI